MIATLVTSLAMAQSPLSCGDFTAQLAPTFSKHFQTYHRDSYMSLWCVRNSENLYRTLRTQNLIEPTKTFAVYIIHRNSDLSISPRLARYNAQSWSNHAFLVTNGLVLDQDFTSSPNPITLRNYLHQMWGHQLDDLVFQIRDASLIDDYTNYGIRESFRKGEHLIVNSQELAQFFQSSVCY